MQTSAGCMKSEKFAAKTVNSLIAVQILLGAMSIIFCEYYKQELGKYASDVERTEINSKFYFVEVYGVCLILLYLYGWTLAAKAVRDLCTAHLQDLINLWNFFVFLLSIFGFLVTWHIHESCEFLKLIVETALYKGIEVYYVLPEWRLIWDAFQYNEQCCGVVDYRDWESLAWIEYIKISDAEIKDLKGEGPKSYTPYSCCSQESVPIAAETYFTQNLTAVYPNGCMAIFSNRLHTTVLLILLIVIAVFVVQVLIFFANRYVFRLTKERYFNLKYNNQLCQTEIACGTLINMSPMTPPKRYENESENSDSKQGKAKNLQRKQSDEHIRASRKLRCYSSTHENEEAAYLLGEHN